MTIRHLFPFLFLLPFLALAGDRPPNIVVIFADDLGYGDLGVYGHPTIATPHLDRMAAEGQKWTDFYAAAPVCSPSRGALLTGKYAIKTGTHAGVFFEWSASGLDPAEVTLAEMLKTAGYATGMVGKWHLGHKPGYRPTDQGFDRYFGIPYSNDMRVDPRMPVADGVVFREGMTLERMRARGNKVNDWVPLMEGEEVVEYPCDQRTLTRRYTERCVGFIRENRDRPFFLYYAQTFPHIPLFASEAFEGTSRRGLYGDVVEEMDHSIGVILETLRAYGLAENTLVVFTSDNGPWLSKDQAGGSAGLLRGGKGETYEGGMRVPGIFWWPGTIAGGQVVGELGTTLDFMATFAGLSGAALPATDLDSHDLSPVLLRGEPGPRESFFFYQGGELFAVRRGPWKAHFITKGAFDQPEPRVEHPTPLLYHLGHDPGEQYDVAADHPGVVAALTELRRVQLEQARSARNRYEDVVDYQDLPAWMQRNREHEE